MQSRQERPTWPRNAKAPTLRGVVRSDQQTEGQLSDAFSLVMATSSEVIGVMAATAGCWAA